MSADLPSIAIPPLSRRYAAWRLAVAKVIHWQYRVLQRRRLAGPTLEWIDGVPLIVLPGVLNPDLTRAGKFFAHQLTAQTIVPGSRVLDMGSGSGVCAVFAARLAARVVAVDISPAAVRCTRLNVVLNECEDRVEVLAGDLFGPLGGRQFDLVLFNPPFLSGEPRDDADRAWRSQDVNERFAAQLRTHLAPGGAALVMLSTAGDAAARFTAQFRSHGWNIAVVAQRDYINERLTLFRLE